MKQYGMFERPTTGADIPEHSMSDTKSDHGPTPEAIPMPGGAVGAVVALLDSCRLMAIAVNRSDGWPQVTTVGYVNDGLNLYFVTARDSQKLANLKADPRVSVAIHSQAVSGDAVGVSMAARAEEVTDPVAVERLNQQVFARYSDLRVFGPGADSVAVVRLRPEIVSPVGVKDGRSQAQSFSLQPPRTESGNPRVPDRA